MSYKYNLYDELGLDRSQDANSLSRELSNRLQELRNNGYAETQGEVQQIKVAGSILSNPVKRNTYDQALDAHDDREIGIAELRRLAANGSLFDEEYSSVSYGSASSAHSSRAHANSSAEATSSAASEQPDDESNASTSLFPVSTPYGTVQTSAEKGDEATALTSDNSSFDGKSAESERSGAYRDSDTYRAEDDQPSFSRQAPASASPTMAAPAVAASASTTGESNDGSKTSGEQHDSTGGAAGSTATTGPDARSNNEEDAKKPQQSFVGGSPYGAGNGNYTADGNRPVQPSNTDRLVSSRDFNEDTELKDMLASAPPLVKALSVVWASIAVIALINQLLWLLNVMTTDGYSVGVFGGEFAVIFVIAGVYYAVKTLRGNDRTDIAVQLGATVPLFVTALGTALYPIQYDFPSSSLTTIGCVLDFIITGLLGAAFGFNFSAPVRQWFDGKPVALQPQKQPTPQQFGPQGPYGQTAQGPHGPQTTYGPQGPQAPQGIQGGPGSVSSPAYNPMPNQPSQPGQPTFGPQGQSAFGQPNQAGPSFGQPGQSPFGHPGHPGQSPYGIQNSGPSPYNQ